METVRLIIKGKVQGVFYRATAKEMADEFDVRGWVKNTADGNVELMATGSKEQVSKFIEWCKKGPKRAVVTSVTVTPRPYEVFPDFRVIK